MKELTIREVAKRGGEALLRKYGKEQLKEWGKKGGRPKQKISTNPLLPQTSQQDIVQEK